MSLNKCRGITRTGKECTRQVKGDHYCFQHRTQQPQPVTEEVVVKPPSPPKSTITEHEKTESCCICLETEIPMTQLLKCQHPVCQTCLTGLRRPECPVCRGDLSGPLVTDEVLSIIVSHKLEDEDLEELQNHMAALALQMGANPDQAYQLYQRR